MLVFTGGGADESRGEYQKGTTADSGQGESDSEASTTAEVTGQYIR